MKEPSIRSKLRSDYLNAANLGTFSAAPRLTLTKEAATAAPVATAAATTNQVQAQAARQLLVVAAEEATPQPPITPRRLFIRQSAPPLGA
mgnify:CR=1 FL=1